MKVTVKIVASHHARTDVVDRAKPVQRELLFDFGSRDTKNTFCRRLVNHKPFIDGKEAHLEEARSIECTSLWKMRIGVGRDSEEFQRMNRKDSCIICTAQL